MKAKPSLKELFLTHDTKVSDKWELYINTWDDIFKHKRDSLRNFLEIGIQNGGSLEIWAKYFINADNIIGIDINDKCKDLIFTDPKINFIHGDALTSETYNKTIDIASPFDIIIDDGSHKSDDIINSFIQYFEHLNYGGLFVVEDLHTSYWNELGGGLFNPMSAISFFKKLIDILNHEHWRQPLTRKALIKNFEETFGKEVEEDTLEEVHSIEFFNSMVVIKKRHNSENVLGKRRVTGKLAIVDPEPLIYNGKEINIFKDFYSDTSTETH